MKCRRSVHDEGRFGTEGRRGERAERGEVPPPKASLRAGELRMYISREWGPIARLENLFSLNKYIIK